MNIDEQIWNDKNAYLLLACLIICAFYIYKPTFIEGDSYYFLMVSQGLWESHEGALTPIFQAFANCPDYFIKIFLCALMFAGMFFVSKAGEILFGEEGWLCGLFLLLNPVFIFESLKFEDEQLFYPLLLFGFFLCVYAIQKNKYWLFAFPAMIILFAREYWIGWFHGIPWFSEPEYMPLMLTVSMLVATIGLLGYYYEKKLRIYAIPALLAYILCLIIPKIAFFATPFLAIGIFPVYKRLKLKNPENELLYEERIAQLFLILAVLIGFAIQFQPITEQQQEIVKTGVKFAEDCNKTLKNEWSWGYLVAWNGGTPSNWAGGDIKYDFNNSIAITQEKIDCEILAQKEGIKVYNCP